ncbi:ATP-binding protein [Pokkaliibacter sp. MBI-7]|uniref:AAA family ATPase n=1 Tax=Pokkaliibacter sp. MBI-7 TaxID=3040600 RepID=UPI002448B7A6|nr:ATP-binding protein [Pokkaliibacter sp. MBI-7]MDH2433442.1 ATP-binding protein [Pokkaliibacter sp. MBI-7]
MLSYLRLQSVGPMDSLDAQFASRLNLITGDNGLGKSFILDIAWWALSRTWIDQPARPQPKLADKAEIAFAFDGIAKKKMTSSRFDRLNEVWKTPAGRPANPGLVLYATVDGGFAVWDPARNYWRNKENDGESGGRERPPAYIFSAEQVWNGLSSNGRPLCNGLIADWAGWQKEKGEHFAQLQRALTKLSPSEEEQLQPGELTRISLDDARDMPTLRMPYGQDVPVLFASAGMKRMLALAYLLVWSWQEHLRATTLIGQEPARQIIFLIDEIEGHLHPRWQRRVFHAVLEVVQALRQSNEVKVQILAATHSPLILTSLEPLFEESRDKLFELTLTSTESTSQVIWQQVPWRKHGEVGNWLTSDVFGLQSARSLEAEQVINEVASLMSMPEQQVSPQQVKKLQQQLQRVLSDTDPLWLRWRFACEQRGWL